MSDWSGVEKGEKVFQGICDVIVNCSVEVAWSVVFCEIVFKSVSNELVVERKGRLIQKADLRQSSSFRLRTYWRRHYGIRKKFCSVSKDGWHKIQEGTLPHIAKPVMQLLKKHFGNNITSSHYFPTDWTSRSPDLKPYDFWLWGCLKNVMFSGPIANLADLKARITRHVHNLALDILRLVLTC
ncbi:uncharacterized protein TNCV_2902331 [Trichonephila clavipes]|nr:uncharacterized protein TNCV_2902331 [Trichonephila clavipes]